MKKNISSEKTLNITNKDNHDRIKRHTEEKKKYATTMLPSFYKNIRAELDRAGMGSNEWISRIFNALGIGYDAKKIVWNNGEAEEGEDYPDIKSSSVTRLAVFLGVDIGVLLYGRDEWKKIEAEGVDSFWGSVPMDAEKATRRLQMSQYVATSKDIDDFLINGLIADTYGDREAILKHIMKSVTNRIEDVEKSAKELDLNLKEEPEKSETDIKKESENDA